MKCFVTAVSSVLREPCQQEGNPNISEGSTANAAGLGAELFAPSRRAAVLLLAVPSPAGHSQGPCLSVVVGEAVSPQKAVFMPPQRTTRLGFPKEFGEVRHPNPTKISSENSQL